MYQLVYRDELGSTRTFPLEGEEPVTIGRERTRHLVLDDRQVSRHHASIELVSGSFLLRDAGSVNGTFLNGLRLSGASAITLRDGDVIEIGGIRVCFATDVALAVESLAPVERSAGEFHETAVPYQDLLRDGLAAAREGQHPDEASVQVLGAFGEGPLVSSLRRTLDALVRRLDIDTGAVYLIRRGSQLERVASRPGVLDARSFADTLDGRVRTQAFLLHRQEESFATNLSDTCVGSREHSAVVVPFFRGASFLGALFAERFTGSRLDRKDAAIVAVWGERIARALSIRGQSPNDTPVGIMGELGDVGEVA
jgi:hypothetical protein